VPHRPYRPDLAPSDFWLFGYVKTSLVGQTFEESGQLLEAITEFLNGVQPPEVVAVSDHWVERVWWVLENNGDYDPTSLGQSSCNIRSGRAQWASKSLNHKKRPQFLA
jgi:hypothetical protein